jgi:hypothetical protein
MESAKIGSCEGEQKIRAKAKGSGRKAIRLEGLDAGTPGGCEAGKIGGWEVGFLRGEVKREKIESVRME